MRNLYLRNLPDDIHERIISSAGVRHLSSAEYISALVRLHERVGVVLDDKSKRNHRTLDDIRHVVDELKLGSVTR